MTYIVYSTTATFTLKDINPSYSIFGEYTTRPAGIYNFITLKKGHITIQLNTSQLIEFREIIDKIIQDLETGVP